MNRDDQLNVIDTLLQRLDSGTNVDAGGQVINPVSAYISAERGKQEWQVFFQD